MTSVSFSYCCLSVASPSPKYGLGLFPQNVAVYDADTVTSILNFISEKIVVYDEGGEIGNLKRIPSVGFDLTKISTRKSVHHSDFGNINSGSYE